MRLYACAECGQPVAAGSDFLLAEGVMHGAHVGAVVIELPEVEWSEQVNAWIIANDQLDASDMAEQLAEIPDFACVPPEPEPVPVVDFDPPPFPDN